MLVITACTNRKRKPVAPDLRMASVPVGDLASVAFSWGERLRGASDRYMASEIYSGRSFAEAATAARLAEAHLCVASAGVGLVHAATAVPAYGCTVAERSADGVAARLIGSFDPAAWWSALTSHSPFALSLAEADSGGALLVALPGGYLAMVAGDLLALPAEALSRLRILTRAPPSSITPALRAYVMPYDDRLDGPDSPIRGTRGDFAARALRHFVSLNVPGTSAKTDAEAVRTALSGWRLPVRACRARHDDAALRELLERNWDRAGGSTARLLRLFRDELNIACEQSRFAELARQVRGARA